MTYAAFSQVNVIMKDNGARTWRKLDKKPYQILK